MTHAFKVNKSMNAKTIVIMGGGIGGIVVANKLRKAIDKSHQIVLIDKETHHLFYPSFLWVMMGWRTSSQIQKSFQLLEKKGIKFLNAEVTEINFETKTVSTSKEKVKYDYLVLALGASTFPERIDGLRENAYDIYSLEEVARLRNDLPVFTGKLVVVLICSTPFKCPAAPYEAALLLASYFKQKGKPIEVQVVTPEQLPLPVAGPEVGKYMVSLLDAYGIKFLPEHQVQQINPGHIQCQKGISIPFDLLLAVPPHGLPGALKNSPILGETGWVSVDPAKLTTSLENVYALGDVTTIPLPVGKPLPKAGVFAHAQAEVVAHNIAAHIIGSGASKSFNGEGSCFVELGDGKAAFAKGNFYTKPAPVVLLKKPSRFRHWQKVLFEKWWLWKWF